MKRLDLLTMGRSGLDLYANEIGAPFPDIKSFAAYVGGSPTNIAVGGRRLGLKTALLTAVGDDPVGDFILAFLQREAVETEAILVKKGARSAAVLLGIEPPDKFPLVFYRDNAADAQLTIDDVLAAPIADAALFEISGTGLSREPARSATLFAAEEARAAGATVALDIDFRADQWPDVRAAGVIIRSALPLVDIVIGTEDEIRSVTVRDKGQVRIAHSQMSAAAVSGDLDRAIARLLAAGPGAVVVKRGANGATVHLANGEVITAPAFEVNVLNVLGAGDAFAAGLFYGLRHSWDWYRAARFGNACGAIIVTRHGCANFMATEAEALAFVEQRGGL
jgi:5-dehydro-2-deoxygluconokinase